MRACAPAWVGGGCRLNTTSQLSLPDTESAACVAAERGSMQLAEEADFVSSGETTPDSTFMYIGAESVVAWRLVVVSVLTRFRRNCLLGET